MLRVFVNAIRRLARLLPLPPAGPDQTPPVPQAPMPARTVRLYHHATRDNAEWYAEEGFQDSYFRFSLAPGQGHEMRLGLWFTDCSVTPHGPEHVNPPRDSLAVAVEFDPAALPPFAAPDGPLWPSLNRELPAWAGEHAEFFRQRMAPRPRGGTSCDWWYVPAAVANRYQRQLCRRSLPSHFPQAEANANGGLQRHPVHD